MIPVDQTRTGAPRGNCTEATIASILGLPLEALPSLWLPTDPEGGRDPRGHRWVQLLGFIVGRGRMLVRWDFRTHAPLDALPRMLDRLPSPYRDIALDCPYYLGGHNPAGVGHAVVARGAEIIHDPNPSRAGLVTVDEVNLLLPLAQVPEEVFGWLMAGYRPWRCDWRLVTSDWSGEETSA